MLIEAYSGAVKDSASKDERKRLGLPVTKQLVYYKDKRDVQSKVNVVSFFEVERFPTWSLIRLQLADESETDIHSSYFVEMQSPSFIRDMEEQEKVLTISV